MFLCVSPPSSYHRLLLCPSPLSFPGSSLCFKLPFFLTLPFLPPFDLFILPGCNPPRPSFPSLSRRRVRAWLFSRSIPPSIPSLAVSGDPWFSPASRLSSKALPAQVGGREKSRANRELPTTRTHATHTHTEAATVHSQIYKHTCCINTQLTGLLERPHTVSLHRSVCFHASVLRDEDLYHLPLPSFVK